MCGDPNESMHFTTCGSVLLHIVKVTEPCALYLVHQRGELKHDGSSVDDLIKTFDIRGGKTIGFYTGIFCLLFATQSRLR